jgi:2,4-dienoyl-CoA reductase (NADPH2)
MACRIPGKEDFARTIAYFETELPRLGVSVRLESRIEDVAALERFDGVVVATGVVPKSIELPGVELPHVRTYAQVLDGGTGEAGGLGGIGGAGGPGESVAIIGAGGIGVDVAHLLSHRSAADPRAAFYELWGLAPGGDEAEPFGDRGSGATERSGGDDARPAFASVTLMCRGPRAGGRIGPSTRWAVLQTLERTGVKTLTGVRYQRIEPGAVVIADSEGREQVVAAQTVVVAAGQEPNASLAAALEAAGQPHVTIGGAASATELDAERAFKEGALAPHAFRAPN